MLNSPQVWLYPHEMAVKLPKPVENRMAVGTLVSLYDPVCAFPALPMGKQHRTHWCFRQRMPASSSTHANSARMRMHIHHNLCSQPADSPQHQALCVESTLQVNALPTLRDVKSEPRLTRTGVGESEVAPLPSWPLAPVPQHTIDWFERSPHACCVAVFPLPLVYTLVKL